MWGKRPFPAQPQIINQSHQACVGEPSFPNQPNSTKIHAMLTPKRARWLSLIFLIVTLLALLGLGVCQNRQDFLTRGIPTELPGPIAHAGTQVGLNVYLNQYDDAELAENLAQIAELGIQHIKQPFYFSDNFDWEEADRVITAVSNANLTLTPLLDGNPADHFAPPANPNDYAQWAGEFARRYGDQIQTYIIWDEPNLTTHWGNQPVNPAEYAALLTAASAAIRQADADAVIVAAPLAPNEETGPQNLADHLYLQQLYEEGADAAFDVAAGKPYGFHTGPDDRTTAHDTLNFSRLILIREVMTRNGDGDKALWAGNWGWNSLPTGWTGDPSVWGQTSAQEQADWTIAALDRASKEWPWAGVFFLENWEPDAPEDDAHWGFSLKRLMIEDLKIKESFAALPASIFNLQSSITYPGFHLASPDDPAQVFEGGWRFSPEFGADISETAEGEAPDTVTFTFWGTEAGLRVRRANFRARLNITVDGQPANALPQDENGAVLILTAADPNEDYLTLETVATNLEPGMHTMEIVANRGWDQWALNGFSVCYAPPSPVWLMRILAGTAVFSFLLAIYCATRAQWGYWLREKTRWYAGLSSKVQVGITAVTAAIVALTGWLTWGAEAAGMYRRLGDGAQLALTAGAAAVFYVAPSFYLYIAALLVLFLLIYFRPAWGVALIAFCIPFYVPPLPKAIFQFRFSPVEIFTLVTLGAWTLRSITDWRFRIDDSRLTIGDSKEISRGDAETQSRFKKSAKSAKSVDYSVLALVLVATVSLFFTERLGVATNEWRMVIVEPALFYLLLRGVKLQDREMWGVLDAFVLSGLVLALIGLWQYAFDPDSLITAEGGLMRVRSIFGSPNNLALYLGRILPLLAAMLLLGKENGTRRWLYSLFLLPMGVVVLLSFSKGALILGLPAAFLYIFWRWQQANGRSTWPWLILFGVLGVVAFAAVLQIPAIAGRLDPRSQTGFFRLNLWQASLNMVKAHPWFGVGLDNFLYAYRGRYILDAAWQEPNLNHPHNIFLDFSTRLGIFGLLTGFWLFGEAGRRLWRKAAGVTAVWQPILVGFGGALVAILFHGLVDHSFFLVDLAYGFMLILGTAVWLEKKTE
ncbi:MAG: O-antigen ligase family protein [Anaerolineae bacterium]|nr:O-antigen ligase family protein [Anaerolineae bacterium]